MFYFLTDFKTFTLPLVTITIGLLFVIVFSIIHYLQQKRSDKNYSLKLKNNNFFSFIKKNFWLFFSLFGIILIIAGVSALNLKGA